MYMKDNIIIGIDASTKSTGVSIFKNNIFSSYRLIRCNDKNVYDRIEYMKKEITKIFYENNPNFVFIENVPLSSSVNKLVAEHLLVLQGVIFSISIDFGCKFITMQPQQWRKLACVKPESRKRESQKKAAIELVNKKYSFEFEWIDNKHDSISGNSDICESILIGEAGIKFIEGEYINEIK